ncbi:hypothetical protein [Rhodococcus aetherivorans]|uniref:hypothetical protein n=1 Tax=Rhodococcus aetherivorans TaxID=191292 RepID=UPI00241BED98|nr:hypothetical protein [Rhodococcus aetherivorans]WFS11083.1 hypothetical protein P9K37_14755 [Rhodococcus aetherivorans]
MAHTEVGAAIAGLVHSRPPRRRLPVSHLVLADDILAHTGFSPTPAKSSRSGTVISRGDPVFEFRAVRRTQLRRR